MQRSSRTSRVELCYTEFFIEVKSDPSYDFFVDPPSPLSGEARAAHNLLSLPEDTELASRLRRALAKHISHVSEIFARQQRVFVFSMTMAGSSARLCRWDRSGVVVTEAFDIREQPDILCDFIWRLSATSAIGRGHDLTVQPATPEEEVRYRDAITQHVRDQTGRNDEDILKAVSEHYESGRVMAVHVLAQRPGVERKIHRYLVSRPVVSPLSPTGRSTKAYWAFCTTTNRVVFLKDTWRDAQDDEGSILAKLNELKVCNVPEFVLHGDIFNGPLLPGVVPSSMYSIGPWIRTPFTHIRIASQLNRTRTANYCDRPWVSLINKKRPDLPVYVHYRMILGTVGYSLRRFCGTKELLHATYDVYQGT